MSEYITLPSNVVYDNNTIAEYRTVLASPKNLKGRWKVGLANISFTKSWFNVKDDHVISLVDSKGNIYKSAKLFEAGYYETERQITYQIELRVADVREEIKKKEKIDFDWDPRVIFNEYSRRDTLISRPSADYSEWYV